MAPGPCSGPLLSLPFIKHRQAMLATGSEDEEGGGGQPTILSGGRNVFWVRTGWLL